MIKISLMIEGQQGINWPRWKRLAAAVEELGFAGLFRSDHFTDPVPPDRDSLDLLVSLAYLADRTERIHFGALVSPVSFREPVMLTRQLAALDDLSGGRALLGMGAGWQEREHSMFGYELGDVPTRMARLEEALQVATRLLRDDGPVSYEGRFYRLREAAIAPRPERPTRLVIGGNGPKRTLPLVARFADVWNGVFLSPDDFRERSARLDRLLRENEREPSSVVRTLMNGLHFGRDTEELDRRLSWRHNTPELAGKPLDEAIALIRAKSPALVGTPDEVAAQIRRYADAGVEEIMLQWFDFDDIDGLQAFAESILPRFGQAA